MAGHNAYLAEAVAEDTVPAWCRGAAWLTPLDEHDFYRILVDVMMLASSRTLVGLVGRAEAPGPDGPRPPAPMSAFGRPSDGAASNGWAFGRDATASGGGLLVANPHFPWNGESRFWESHLTLDTGTGSGPDLDVYGTSLVGMPGIQIGFNRHVAWTHTVSKGHRFTLARLDLLPGSPTSYRYGDETRDMTATTHRVTVRDEGKVERTLWRSHHGPMLNLPLLGWGTEVAYTYRDANIDNVAAFPTWLAMMGATGLDDFQAAFADHQGIPWVNTLAADDTGRAWYVDGSATPNLSREAQARFVDRLATDPIAAFLFENRVATVDGSDPGDEWVDDPGARSPGLVPFSRQPQLERADVLLNANDAHWLTNVDEPLTGYSVLHGLERAPISQRTRANHVAARAVAATGVTVDTALDAMFDNASITATRLRGPVADRLRAGGLDAAAAVLDRWDGRCDLDSRGAALWRELMAGFTVAELTDRGRLFGDRFDPDRPLDTPAELAPSPGSSPEDDPLVAAAREAIALLERAGVALDAPLGAVQWVHRGGRRIPIHGGGEPDGVANIMSSMEMLVPSTVQPPTEPKRPFPERVLRTGLAADGYPCTYGASIVLAVDLTPDGPVAKGLLAYGQSSDPDAPDAAEQPEAFAARRWRTVAYTEAAIAADTRARRHLTT